MNATPYLNFDSKCREAFDFYADLFDGTIEMMQTHAESPIADEVPSGWGDLILHARLTRGDLVLMGSDSPPGRYEPPGSISVSLQVDTPEEADRIFGGLAEGGSVTMPIEETFWAARFGMVKDRFGIPWMVNCDKS